LHDVVDVLEGLDSFLPQFEVVSVFELLETKGNLVVVGFRGGQIQSERLGSSIIRVEGHGVDDGSQTGSDTVA